MDSPEPVTAAELAWDEWSHQPGFKGRPEDIFAAGYRMGRRDADVDNAVGEAEAAEQALRRVMELEAALSAIGAAVRGLPDLDLDMEPGRMTVYGYISRAELLALLPAASEKEPRDG